MHIPVAVGGCGCSGHLPNGARDRRIRVRARRRAVRSCGALLVMASLVQYSLAAGFEGNENARSLRQMSPPSPSSLRRHGRRGESKSRPLGGGPGGVGGGDGTNTHGDCEKSLRRRGGGDLPTTTTVYSHVYSRGDVVEGVYVGHRNGAPPAAAVAAAESGATGPSSPAGLTGAVEDDAETRQTSAATVEYGAATLTTATAAAKGEGDVAKRRQQHRYSSGGNRSLTTGYGSNANESGNPCWGSGGGGGSSNNGGGNGVLGGVAAARERAFLAGSSAKLTAMGQRGGGGGIGGWGGRVGGQGSPTLPARDNQQQQQQDQFRQDPQSMQEEYGLEEPWDGQQEEGVEGYMSEGGFPGPVPPVRTPLQEQVYQTKFRHHHGSQIRGQAVGTQQRASSLFRRAGGGGVFFVFFILVWRSLSNYEHVNQLSGAFRGVMMVPAIGLFVGNLLCMCLAVVQSATSRQKARMKSMLSIQAVAEGTVLLYNLVSLLRGSGRTPREEHISRMLASAWCLSICFTFAKARWVADGAY